VGRGDRGFFGVGEEAGEEGLGDGADGGGKGGGPGGSGGRARERSVLVEIGIKEVVCGGASVEYSIVPDMAGVKKFRQNMVTQEPDTNVMLFAFDK
jgi:hypothetical protein